MRSCFTIFPCPRQGFACLGSITLWRTAMMAIMILISLGFARTDVIVQTTPGGPRIVVNGQPVPARMFWGQPGFSTVAAIYRWAERSFEFTAPFAAWATLHFRFGKQAGRIWLADLRFEAIDDGEAVLPYGSFADSACFADVWNVFPPDERNTVGEVQIADSMLCIQLVDPPSGAAWPDFHLWSTVKTLQAGRRYRCSFRVKASPARPITPTIYHVSSGSWTPIAGPSGPFLYEVELARDVGVNFISFSIANCWAPPEQEPNWRDIEVVFRRIIDVHPQALLVPRVSLDAPTWWKDRHPEALMVYEDGSVGSMASISHRQYRADAAAHLERLCRFLTDTFPDHFAGIHPCGQNTGEWFYEGAWGAKLSGYDSATLQAWQSYPDGGGPVPTATERRTAAQSLLLDPALQQPVIRFNQFLQEEMAEFITELAAAARRGTDGRKLVFFFYGYHYEFGPVWNGPAASGHYGLSRVLESPDIDVLCGPLSYCDRHLLGTGPVMSPAESITGAGKLWFNEDDTRTYLNRNPEDHARHGGLADLEQTQSVLLRNTAQASLRGLGTWWMDHGAGTDGGWFADPALWQVMQQMRPIDEALLERSTPFAPEIVAIIDEKSLLHLAGGSTAIGNSLISNSRTALGRCGAPYGQVMLEDVLAGKINSKLQVFLAAWALSLEERRILEANRPPGITRVWCYAPGYILPEGFSVRAMKSVTGFSHRLVDAPTAVAAPTAMGLSLGLTDAWGPATKIHPLFSAVANPQEVLATYSDGSPAVAMRKSDRGMDVFVGTPQLTPELIRALAREAGVHLYTEKDAGIWAAESVLSVHDVGEGSLALDIGSDSPVFDALSGVALGKGPVLYPSLSMGETRVVRWERPVSVDSRANAGPGRFALSPNYPNPFNTRTVFRFSVPEEGHVSLQIFDLLGRRVSRLIDGRVKAGEHQMVWHAGHLPGGVYFCRLQAGGQVLRRKLVLVK